MKIAVKILFLGLLTLGLAVSSAFARGPQNVGATAHNLAVNNSDGFYQYRTNEEEVCIFCHTPHGGVLNGPLWNRSLPGSSSFTHYNSATLSPTVGGATRAVNDESLLCLSCHDGTVATNRILNTNNNNPSGQPDNIMLPGQAVEVQPGIGIAGPRIGATNAAPTSTGDLTDDHPISFSYVDAYAYEVANSQNGLVNPATILATVGERPVFFGDQSATNAGALRVECSSCHDPHVYADDWFTPPTGSNNTTGYDLAYRPFLIMPNSGSAMCLACHNK